MIKIHLEGTLISKDKTGKENGSVEFTALDYFDAKPDLGETLVVCIPPEGVPGEGLLYEVQEVRHYPKGGLKVLLGEVEVVCDSIEDAEDYLDMIESLDNVDPGVLGIFLDVWDARRDTAQS